MRIWMIDGQGGWIFSTGWRAFGARLKSLGFDVSLGWSARYPIAVVEDMEKYIGKKVVMGYSLGANCATWVAARAGFDIDLLVAYDPTVNSYVNSIGPNVKRALCYQQVSYIGTSLLFGRASIKSGPKGPPIETVSVSTDHLLVQTREDLHTRTIAALREAR